MMYNFKITIHILYLHFYHSFILTIKT